MLKTIGFIGLGRMGKEMVLHLLEEGWKVVAFNRSREKTEELKKEFQKLQSLKPPSFRWGELVDVYSLEELISALVSPRIIWLMVEAGQAVDEVIFGKNYLLGMHVHGEKGILGLASHLEKGDILIDGGNSFYKDSQRRFEELEKRGIHFLDVGTSGGLEGAREGACLMIGGEKEVYQKLEPLFQALAGEKGGYAYFGVSGAGHFVKMVHNGVEYGMLQAIGEGFEILSKSKYHFDLYQIASNWNKGSVVRGWLMELLEKALKKDASLSRFSGTVGGGTTGEWTVQTAKELKVEVPVLKKSLEARKKSKKKPNFAGKVISALRYEFGGHKE